MPSSTSTRLAVPLLLLFLGRTCCGQDPLSSSWMSSRDDLPQIKALDVACEKNRMRVSLTFDRPFHGTVFSKGHFSDTRCVHLPPSSGRLHARFDLPLGTCGTTASRESANKDNSNNGGGRAYLENTVVIQFDPMVQEAWDQARKLRCTWYDHYEKAIAFSPFNVDTLQAVNADFLGDNLQCWMQIQKGQGPWAPEVSGIVKIGQTMTLVLAIKDDEDKFDLLPRDCVAHDGKRKPIQLVDKRGCVVRPKLMGTFRKVRPTGVTSASAIAYAAFQAFKFPDATNVFFQCVVQVCRERCPEPACDGSPDVISNVGALPPPSIMGSHIEEPNLLSESVLSLADDKMLVPRPYLPPPSAIPVPVPMPFSSHLFPSLGRVGVPPSPNISTPSPSPAIAGPRKIDQVRRRRREADAPTADVRATSRLQVVSPGDLAFDSTDPSLPSVSVTKTESVICVPTTGLVAGCVLLLLLLTLSLLAALFLGFRLRAALIPASKLG